LRPRQLVHVLSALFSWRGERKGRRLQIVGGSGMGSNTGFLTRITERGKGGAGGKKIGENEKEKDNDEEEEEVEEQEKDMMQIALPPMTGKADESFAPDKTGTYGTYGYVHSPLPKNYRGYGLLEVTLETGDTGDPRDVVGTVDAR